MNRVLFAAAALTLAVTTGPGLLGQAQAAPAAKAPECSVASRANDASWQEHYHCWNNGQAAATAPAVPVAAQPAPSTKSPECSVASRANDASWQEHYHCWK